MLAEGLVDEVLLAWLLGPGTLWQSWTGMGNNPGKGVGSCPGGIVAVGIKPTGPCMKCWAVVSMNGYPALDGTCPTWGFMYPVLGAFIYPALGVSSPAWAFIYPAIGVVCPAWAFIAP